MGRIQGPSRRRDIQDIPPQSRILQNIVTDFRKLTSHPPGTKASAAFPGIIAWDDMFKGDDFNLPDTSLMSQFRDVIPYEQFQQIAKEVVRKISNVKENFCKRMYYALPDAHQQLYTLLTEVMMDESEHTINKAIEETERELAKLKQISSRVESIAHPMKANRSQH